MKTLTQKEYNDEVVRLAETFIKNGDFNWLNQETERVAASLGVPANTMAVDIEWHIEDLIGL